jgi:hypothetical protein
MGETEPISGIYASRSMQNLLADLLSIRLDAYHRALSTNLFTKTNPKGPDLDPEQIVPIVLARAGAEKRAIEAGKGGEDAFGTLVKVVEDGLVMVRQGT